jgi:hypothetical protein
MDSIVTRIRRPLERFRVIKPVPGPPEQPDVMGATAGRFPTLTMKAVPVNPYKPGVVPNHFPDVPMQLSRWTPPSIRPQMVIRTGPTPQPTGASVPPGATHTRPVRMP